jgi:hypothetical protein
MIIAGIGIQFTARRLSRFCARVFGIPAIKVYVRSALSSLVIISAFWSAIVAAPHYRLYMNALGGGPAKAGAYFPQDEFYDSFMQNAMAELAKRARTNAHIASEIPAVAAYYAQRANRPDLICVELSDPAELEKLTPGDFVIDARGRTYFTNQAMLTRLRGAGQPAFTIALGAVPAANVYFLDQKSLDALRGSR